ncbi:ADP-ribosylation factor GTPase activating protein, ER-Golgi transport [Dispira simplex]|nr:ADP-ribosylation factor GTPase activating protein, ER-Golgi transport [Dispira simplex]
MSRPPNHPGGNPLHGRGVYGAGNSGTHTGPPPSTTAHGSHTSHHGPGSNYYGHGNPHSGSRSTAAGGGQGDTTGYSGNLQGHHHHPVSGSQARMGHTVYSAMTNQRTASHGHSPYLSPRSYSNVGMAGGNNRGVGGGPDPLLHRYTLRPPEDLPALQPSRKEYPDYFPNDGHQPEDQMTENYVRTGFVDQPVIASEHSSIHELMFDHLQDSDVMTNLANYAINVLKYQKTDGYGELEPRTCGESDCKDENDQLISHGDRSSTTVNGSTARSPLLRGPRWHVAVPILTSNRFQHPVIKLYPDSAEREQWWQNLANPAVPLASLVYTVPRGYRKERLLDALLQWRVPISRALWIIQVVGCDEIQAILQTKNIPKSSAIDSYTKEWTIYFLNYIKRVLSEATVTLPNTRGASDGSTGMSPGTTKPDGNGRSGQPPPSSTLSSGLDKAGLVRWAEKWTYLWRLARAQSDQELIDLRRVLRVLVEELDKCTLEQFVLYLPFMYEYVTDIQRARLLLRLFLTALTNQAPAVMRLPPTLRVLVISLVQHIFITCPDVFVDPSNWWQIRTALRTLVFVNQNPENGLVQTSALSWSENGEKTYREFAWLTSPQHRVRLEGVWDSVERRNSVFASHQAVPFYLNLANDVTPTVPSAPLALERRDSSWELVRWLHQIYQQPIGARAAAGALRKLLGLFEELQKSVKPVKLIQRIWSQSTALQDSLAHCQMSTASSASDGSLSTVCPKSSPQADVVRITMVAWFYWWMRTQDVEATHRLLGAGSGDLTYKHLVDKDSRLFPTKNSLSYQVYTLSLVLQVFRLGGVGQPRASHLIKDKSGALLSGGHAISIRPGSTRSATPSLARGSPILGKEAYIPREWPATVPALLSMIRAECENHPPTWHTLAARQRLLYEVLGQILTDLLSQELSVGLAYIYGELTKANLFSYSSYVQRIIARGHFGPRLSEMASSNSDTMESKKGSSDTLSRGDIRPFFAKFATLSEAELQSRQVALYKSNHLKFDHAATILSHAVPTDPEYQEFRVVFYWQQAIAARLPWLVAYDAQTRGDQGLTSSLFYRLLPTDDPTLAVQLDRLNSVTWSPAYLFPYSMAPVASRGDLARLPPVNLIEQIVPVQETVTQGFYASRLYHVPCSTLVGTTSWRTVFGTATDPLCQLQQPFSPYMASRLLDTWLLPMVRHYVVKATEVDADNWRIITQPGSSLLNARQAATVLVTMALVDSAAAQAHTPPNVWQRSLSDEHRLTLEVDLPDLSAVALRNRYEFDHWLLGKNHDPHVVNLVVNDLLSWKRRAHLLYDAAVLWQTLRDKYLSLLDRGIMSLALVTYLVASVGGSNLTVTLQRSFLADVREQWRQWRLTLFTKLAQSRTLGTVAPEYFWHHNFDYVPLVGSLTNKFLVDPLSNGAPTYYFPSTDTGTILYGQQLLHWMGRTYLTWCNAHTDQPLMQFLTSALDSCLEGCTGWVTHVQAQQRLPDRPWGTIDETLLASLRQLSLFSVDYIVVARLLVCQEPPTYAEVPHSPFARPHLQTEEQVTASLVRHWERCWQVFITESLATRMGSDQDLRLTVGYRRLVLVNGVLALVLLQCTAQHVVSYSGALASVIGPVLTKVVQLATSPTLEKCVPVALLIMTSVADTCITLLGLMFGLALSTLESQSIYPNHFPLEEAVCVDDYVGLQAARNLTYLVEPPTTPGALPPNGLVTVIQALCSLDINIVRLVGKAKPAELPKALRQVGTDCCQRSYALRGRLAGNPWVCESLGDQCLQLYQSRMRALITWLTAEQDPSQLTNSKLSEGEPGRNPRAGSEAESFNIGPVVVLLADWFGQVIFTGNDIPSVTDTRGLSEVTLLHRITLSTWKAMGRTVVDQSNRTPLPLTKTRLAWLLDVYTLRDQPAVVAWYDEWATTYGTWVQPHFPKDSHLSVAPLNINETGSNGYTEWLLHILCHSMVGLAAQASPEIKAQVNTCIATLEVFPWDSLAKCISHQQQFLEPPTDPSVDPSAFLFFGLSELSEWPSWMDRVIQPGKPLVVDRFAALLDAFGLFTSSVVSRLVTALDIGEFSVPEEVVQRNLVTIINPPSEIQKASIEAALQGYQSSLLRQLTWFQDNANVLNAMCTLAQDYYTAAGEHHKLVIKPSSEICRALLTIDAVMFSLRARMRTVTAMVPFLVARTELDRFTEWVITLIRLLNSIIGPWEHLGSHPHQGALFDLTLDVASVCQDELPSDSRTPFLGKLRQLIVGLQYYPFYAPRLRRILPYEVQNIYSRHWKPNPHVPFNPWILLDTTVEMTNPSQPVTGSTKSNEDGSTTDKSNGGSLALVNSTPLSLSYFGTKRYRTVDDSVYVKYARIRNMTLDCLYGNSALTSQSTDAATKDLWGNPLPTLSLGLGTTATTYDQSELVSTCLNKGPSHRLDTVTSQGTTSDAQEEGEIPLKRNPNKQEIQEFFRKLQLRRENKNDSTTLDSWTWDQLRVMKVGGNANLAEFFRQHGGVAKYNDAKTKYSSCVAQQYKDKLNRLAQEDAKIFPNRVVLSGDACSIASASNIDADFFAAFEAPSKTQASMINHPSTTSSSVAPALSSRGSSATRSPPVLTKSPTSPASPNTTPNISAVPSRTTTRSMSSSLRSKTSVGTGGGARGKRGLGATKKMGVTIKSMVNFDEAEKLAKASVVQHVTPSTSTSISTPASDDRSHKTVVPASKPLGRTTRITQQRLLSPTEDRGNDANVDRLGMGVARLGFGAVEPTKPQVTCQKQSAMNLSSFGSTVSHHSQADGDMDARDRFGSAKAISSDQFFGHDEDEEPATKERLRQFSESTAISSADYFGRDDDEERAMRSGDANLDMQQLGNLANEAAQRLLQQAGTDMDSVKQALQSGSTKLSSYLRDFQSRYS